MNVGSTVTKGASAASSGSRVASSANNASTKAIEQTMGKGDAFNHQSIPDYTKVPPQNSQSLSGPVDAILGTAPKEEQLKPKMEARPVESYDPNNHPNTDPVTENNHNSKYLNNQTNAEQKVDGGKKVFEDSNGNEVKEGQKVAPGREVDENGTVKDSSTKKLTKVAGQAAAAYFTGGSSLGTDQQIMNNRMVDHTIGVVADTAEKVPGVSEIADELDEAGITDTVGDALNIAGDIKNGDIESSIKHVEDLKENTKKTKKYVSKKVLKVLILTCVPLILVILIIVGIIGPVVGGFIDLTDRISEKVEDVAELFSDLFGGLSPDIVMSDWVANYDTLTFEQQRIVTAAAALVGKPYQWGGKPTGAGMEGVPSTGLDCSGYVQWVLWTAYGVNPGYLSTSKISDLAQEGKRLKMVSKEELQPGDIGLKWLGYREGETNHTGIYAGNGYWFHAANEKAGIIRSKYDGFTVYYRYISDNPTGATGDYATWRQMDSRWSNIMVGNSGKTLGQIGCLVTSISILIEKAGANRTIIPFNPGTFLQALNSKGGFTSGGGLYYSAVGKAVPNFQYVGGVNLRGMSQAEKLQTIKQYLDQGYYLATEVKGATPGNQHWVAVMGVTGNGVSMVDPASNSTDMWSKYNWSKTSQFKYFKAS